MTRHPKIEYFAARAQKYFVKIVRREAIVFSGIVEAQGQVIHQKQNSGTLVISVSRPGLFEDVVPGHSLSVNGVCLTVENLDKTEMEFALSPETLRITGWNKANLLGQTMNLERSLRFGDRVHGHLVTGHVEAVVRVTDVVEEGASRILFFELPDKFRKFVLPKGSVAIHGVSLTVNEVREREFSVCLIPETLRRTNLIHLKVGDTANFESDYLLRAAGNLWN